MKTLAQLPDLMKFAIGLIAGIAIGGASASALVESRGDTYVEAGGNVVVHTPEVTAATVCSWEATEIATVAGLAGEPQYRARFNVEGQPRYDLTWGENTDIVVERLEGAELKVWPEQQTQAFRDCVANKDKVVVEGAH